MSTDTTTTKDTEGCLLLLSILHSLQTPLQMHREHSPRRLALFLSASTIIPSSSETLPIFQSSLQLNYDPACSLCPCLAHVCMLLLVDFQRAMAFRLLALSNRPPLKRVACPSSLYRRPSLLFLPSNQTKNIFSPTTRNKHAHSLNSRVPFHSSSLHSPPPQIHIQLGW